MQQLEVPEDGIQRKEMPLLTGVAHVSQEVSTCGV